MADNLALSAGKHRGSVFAVFLRRFAVKGDDKLLTDRGLGQQMSELLPSKIPTSSQVPSHEVLRILVDRRLIGDREPNEHVLPASVRPGTVHPDNAHFTGYLSDLAASVRLSLSSMMTNAYDRRMVQ